MDFSAGGAQGRIQKSQSTQRNYQWDWPPKMSKLIAIAREATLPQRRRKRAIGAQQKIICFEQVIEMYQYA